MRIRCVILFSALAAVAYASSPFRTARLEQIAKAARIDVRTELLSANAETDSVTIIKGHAVHMRTDGFGDVAHIGYHLFHQALIEHYQRRPLFEFIERYLLELDLRLDKRDAQRRMDADRVVVIRGTLDKLRRLTPNTPNVQFNFEEIPRHYVRLTWILSEGDEVVVTIPTDCQLIVGANVIELEQMFQHDIRRMLPTGGDIIQDWSRRTATRAGDVLVVEGGHYISSEIRGDIYLTQAKGQRRLLCSPKSPTRSVSNIMLTGIYSRELPMKMALNMYGNKTDTLDVALQQFTALCETERCRMFFGIKERTDSLLTGTLFAYNEDMSYSHMLSVEFPLSILSGSNDPIRATAYVYVPLHLISDRFFNQDFNPKKE